MTDLLKIRLSQSRVPKKEFRDNHCFGRKPKTAVAVLALWELQGQAGTSRDKQEPLKLKNEREYDHPLRV